MEAITITIRTWMIGAFFIWVDFSGNETGPGVRIQSIFKYTKFYFFFQREGNVLDVKGIYQKSLTG